MVVTCNHHLLLQKTNNTKLCVFASTNEKTSTTPSETDAPRSRISPACATTSGDCFAPPAADRQNRSFKALSGKGSAPAPPPPFRHTPFRPRPRHTATVWRNLGQHPHRDGTFTFSAKERDPETGLSYFGSRYYSSDLSIWLSVDPMSDKYPSFSPYVYCANNPVRCVDPDGEEVNPIYDRDCRKLPKQV